MSDNIPEYRIIRSRRKSLALEVTSDMLVLVRAPLKLSEAYIVKFVESHTDWIREKLRAAEERQAPPLTNDDEKRLKAQAGELLPAVTEYYSSLMGLFPTGIKITSAKKRFGSCNAKNGICYSYQLLRYPRDAIDYVVVHELAHIKHKNHGREFYQLIEKYLPDYKRRRELLRGRPVR